MNRFIGRKLDANAEHGPRWTAGARSMRGKWLIAAAVIAAGLSVATPGGASELWRTAGLRTPESVVHDARRQRLIVSNMNGGPAEADGNGYLSLLTTDGAVVAEQWARGMDAPKGMAIVGNRLYVADITKLHVVDMDSGAIVSTLSLEGAVFLNDVTAADSGDVYVTDLLSNAIYRVRDGKADLWLRSEALGTPNGILAIEDRLIVGAWGRGMRADFSTEVPGGLLSVDLATKAVAPVPGAERFGNIDGIVAIGQAIVATDYLAGRIWSCRAGQSPHLIATLGRGSADLGTDGKSLFVPMMIEGEVRALSISMD